MRRACVVAALALLVGAATGCKACGKGSAPTVEDRATIEKAKVAKKFFADRASAPRLDAMQVIEDSQKDPMGGDSKYEGQLYAVVGTVAEIGGGRILIHDRRAAVACPLPADQLAAMTVGEPVTVTGFFGKGGGHVAARLERCEVMVTTNTDATRTGP